MIEACPPTNDPVIKDLCAHLNRIIKAKFYIGLLNDEAASGFYSHAQSVKECRREALAHLRKYPTWRTATVSDAASGVIILRRAVIRNG